MFRFVGTEEDVQQSIKYVKDLVKRIAPNAELTIYKEEKEDT